MRREAWAVPLREFMEDGYVGPADPLLARLGNRLPKTVPPEARPAECEAVGYDLHVGPGWQILTVEGEPKPVAWYNRQRHIVIHHEHLRRGLGTFLVVWRREYEGHITPKPPYHQTPEAREMTRKAHRLLVERAIRRGEKVPPEVLADYPDLA